MFGDELCPIDNQRIARFPKNIWKNVQWNNWMVDVAREALRRNFAIDKFLPFKGDCTVFEVKLLTNINTTTNEITRYSITQEKRDEIVGELMMLVSTNFCLYRMRDEYAETKIIMKKETKGLEDEELNRAITEFNE